MWDGLFSLEGSMSRKSLLLTTVLLALPAVSQPAWSWGGDGHRIVGAVADQVLASHPAAKAKVSALLNGRSLSEASVFADCAKGFMYCHRAASDEERAYVAKNPDHHAYHYTDIPIQQPRYNAGTAGTARDDVVQVIRYAVQMLRGTAPTDGPADLKPEEAVWVLAHLVGDIHQPLHVGAIYYDHACQNIVDPNVAGASLPHFGIGGAVLATTGSNDFMISGTKNLHSYWDDSVVVGAMRLRRITPKAFDQFAADIVAHPPVGWETNGDMDDWSAAWASEIMPAAKDALDEVDIGEASQKTGQRGATCTADVSFDKSYSDAANRVALTQLGKAGFRLAALFIGIFEGR
jgi:hypothetical protein